MSAQDDVAVLVRAVGKGGTVEERAAVLVSKIRQLVAGMKNSITDPNALTALVVLDEAIARAGDEIARAVAGNSEVPHEQHEPQPEPWHDVEDEPEDEEPPEPEPIPHKRKSPVRRKK